MQKKAKKKEQKNKKFMTYIKNKKVQLVAINQTTSIITLNVGRLNNPSKIVGYLDSEIQTG